MSRRPAAPVEPCSSCAAVVLCAVGLIALFGREEAPSLKGITAAGKTASEFVNSAGTSVVISKVKKGEENNNILEERKSSIGLQSSIKPMKTDESHHDAEDH